MDSLGWAEEFYYHNEPTCREEKKIPEISRQGEDTQSKLRKKIIGQLQRMIFLVITFGIIFNTKSTFPGCNQREEESDGRWTGKS